MWPEGFSPSVAFGDSSLSEGASGETGQRGKFAATPAVARGILDAPPFRKQNKGAALWRRPCAHIL